MAKELDDIEPHSGLQQLRTRLQNIHDAISNFQSSTAKLLILDSSLDIGPGGDPSEDGQWFQQEHIPGLKKLRDSVKIDLDVLEKVCSFFSGLSQLHSHWHSGSSSSTIPTRLTSLRSQQTRLILLQYGMKSYVVHLP